MQTKTSISIAILIVFHLIGIGGFVFGDVAQFALLTPLNLLLTMAILFFNHKDWSKWWVFALSYSGGFLIEVIGVNTGWPFGVYEYGSPLGPQLFQTPLVIGVNWMMLLYATNAISKPLFASHWLSAAMAAALMTLLDLLIEPVAIALNFWTWQDTDVPMTNYLAWFAISLLLSIVWQRSGIILNRKIAVAVFAVQMGFFLVLGFI